MNARGITAVLQGALSRYSYPSVVWDFAHQCERRLPSMREVETFIGERLVSRKPDMVKQGLANVLFWGHYSAGYCNYRVENFLSRLTQDQLRHATDFLPKAEGPTLRKLKSLGLPQFSQVSFLSKLRMFLDPSRYVVLDLQLAQLRDAPSRTVFQSLTVYSGIPCSGRNEEIYARWCSLCCKWGQKLRVPAVDVERAVWQLLKEDQAKATSVVSSMEVTA